MLGWLFRIVFFVTLIERWFFWRKRLADSTQRVGATAALPESPSWVKVLGRVVSDLLISTVGLILALVVGFVVLWYLIDIIWPIRPIHEW